MNAIMTKKFKLMKDQKGMTLIELLAVVVILGILAAIAGAAVLGGFDSSKKNADKTTEAVVTDAIQRYVLDGNVTIGTTDTTITIATLVSTGYLKGAPNWSDNKALTSVAVKYTSTSDKTIVYTYTPAKP